jgi:hypothetical protein
MYVRKWYSSVHVHSEAEGYRGLAQHGGPPGWLEKSDPQAGCDFVRDGRPMPSALTDHTMHLPWSGADLFTKCTQNTVMSYVTQGRHDLLL